MDHVVHAALPQAECRPQTMLNNSSCLVPDLSNDCIPPLWSPKDLYEHSPSLSGTGTLLPL